MRELSIGVIGTGFIGLQHIESIRRVPNVRVAAIADSSADRARAAAERMGVPKWYTGYRELLDDPSIDAIHNCTPNGLHFPINAEAMERGKHVYCEKPLALDSNESARLVELSERYGVAAAVNFNYRHNAIVQQMRQMVLEGQAGRPLMLTGQYLQDGQLHGQLGNGWRMDPKMGGRARAIADIGSHLFDTAQAILGERITALYANNLTVFPTRKRITGEQADGTPIYEEVPITSDDASFILGRFESGTPFSFTVSQVSAGYKNALSLCLSGSTLLLEWHQQRPDTLHIGHRETPNETILADGRFLSPAIRDYATLPGGHPVGWQDAFTNGIKAFYRSIQDGSYREKQQLWATFEAGHHVMRLVDACLESSETGRWVEL